MPTLLRTTGIVLRNIPHGETSVILTVFTREYGKLGLMVKGARAKKKTGSNAGLEVFTEAQFVAYVKSTRELQLVKEWSIDRPRLGLRTDFTLLAVASSVIELLTRSTRENDALPALYDAAASVLAALDIRPANPLPLLWRFELELHRVLGFQLQLATCGESGRTLIPPFSGGLRYRIQDGAFLHPTVDPRANRDGELSPEAFALLARLPEASAEFAARITVNSRVTAELNHFLAQYVEAHLPVKGHLRSLDALNW
ncbi:DNA repair protein RecO [candidate division KSB1 bacterium]|nr:DNA repair protein RecO [candidate division KSB1 bacterium]